MSAVTASRVCNVVTVGALQALLLFDSACSPAVKTIDSQSRERERWLALLCKFPVFALRYAILNSDLTKISSYQ